MEALKPSPSTFPKVLSPNSPFASPFPTRASKNSHRFRFQSKGNSSSLYRNSSSSFVVFAKLDRTKTRRNSLREKLIRERKIQVRPDSDTQLSNPPRESALGDDGSYSDFRVEKSDSASVGDSVMVNELQNWVEQYKREAEFWGIGTRPIFTVYVSTNGNVDRVSVNKDEILRRSRVESEDFEGSAKVKRKVSEAESLAREMEKGSNVIPRNSSVAKFVTKGNGTNFFEAIRSFGMSPKAIQEIPRVGIMFFYVFVAVWAVKKLFDFREKEVKLTESENEMMRRKIKSRKEREVSETSSVEVIVEPLKQPMFSSDKPKLDKKELMQDISRAKAMTKDLALPGSQTSKASESADLNDKIQEIRRMAREARETEGGKNELVENEVVVSQKTSGEAYNGAEVGKEEKEEAIELLNHILLGDKRNISDESANNIVEIDNLSSHEASSDARESSLEDLNRSENGLSSARAAYDESYVSRESSVREKPRIIRSVEEAREYLSERHQNEDLVQQNNTFENPQSDAVETLSDVSDETLVSSSVMKASQDSVSENHKIVAIGNGKPEAYEEEQSKIQKQEISLDDDSDDDDSESGEETWNENNVDEQIQKKIGLGFKDSYMAAREMKSKQPSSSMAELESIRNEELDWMEDDHLAEIVFRVRENELAGRDPFDKMEAEDKDAFFKGLEKKVEAENEKLSVLHQWLHSNIENLDYGIDGISVYDPPEKIVPRWKGPVLEKRPEFLNNYHEQRKAFFAENTPVLKDLMKDELLQKSAESSPIEKTTSPKKKLHQKPSKTIIEASDGSVKPGKKLGKEFWQHTKKWSRGFLEVYNAETDPEVKSAMKDIGKDLDRWITEKEIEEAGELIDQLPQKSKEFVEKKVGKIRREMELFGPQAVVSKYREYADDNEEDYLWWLDLPHILCIELYTTEDEEQRIGFYSLEMASDLELEPKPHHVIAFEDASDCKNLCYIIQSQMETLGNGHAFVVAQPPKSAFREAKENGFNVTVIRKGELQLNVDLTLAEVEEQISEIGSKMYHDAIMRERSIDISSLTKGVFGFKTRSTKTKKKKPKNMLQKHKKK